MRVLVTGSRGAVGTHLVAELQSRGHEVWGTDRGHHHEGRFLRCDTGEYRQLESVIERSRPEVVFHLAGEFGRRNGEDFYESMWKTNAVGGKNLLSLQRRMGYRSILFSSSEVYGDYGGLMSEDVLENVAIRQLNDYAMSKWVNEMQALNAADDWGAELVRIRLFNTYGPGEYFSEYRSAVCRFIYKAIHREPLTIFTDHKRTSTYVTDTCWTLANIADNFVPGAVYNIGGGELHDMRSVNDTILDHLGLDDSHVSYEESEPMTTKDKIVDTERAVADLGHAPKIALEQGIPLTIDWMRGVYGEPREQLRGAAPGAA